MNSTQQGDDRGQALPVVTAMLVLTVVALAIVAAKGQQAVTRSRLQAGADAVALAAAAGDATDAQRVAGRNSVRIVEMIRTGTEGEDQVVTVEVGPVPGSTSRWHQSARAGAAAQELPGADSSSSIDPALVAALAAASDEFGELIVVDVVDGASSPNREPAQELIVTDWTASLLNQVGWDCDGVVDGPNQRCRPPARN